MNLKASLCFHWKSLRRQVRVIGTVEKVTEKKQMTYYFSRPYKNKLVHGPQSQSEILR